MFTRKFDPEPGQFLHFVELDEFCADWNELGLDVETDLLELQFELMRHPESGDVVAETGGLRKLRFAAPRSRSGKRGAIRVGYVWWPQYRLILLVMAYGKASKDDLSAAEKQGIRQYLQRVEQWLVRRSSQKNR